MEVLIPSVVGNLRDLNIELCPCFELAKIDLVNDCVTQSIQWETVSKINSKKR